jgi:signal transduction histidine kinase
VSKIFHLALENNSSEWMNRLIRIRWIIAFSTLFITIVASYLLPNAIHFYPLLITIIIFVGFNTALFIHSHLVKSKSVSSGHYAFIAHLQMLIDLLFLTIFLHFLGGLETHFFFFYLIYVIIASFLFNRSISFTYAVLANIFFLTLLVLEWQELIPHYNLYGFRLISRFQQPIHIFATSFTLFITSLFAVHIISTMVGRLRGREQELLEMNVACQLRTSELSEANQSCELKTNELAEMVQKLQDRERELTESNLVCELKTNELAELNARLERLDKARTQFIWAVTHELRAPVAAIQSYMKLILEGYIPAEKLNDVIHKAEKQALRQLDLINDLLQLARLEDLDLETKAEAVDVVQILEEVNDSMRILAEGNEISFNVHVDNYISLAKANPEHVKSLWTNLISNAIKYTDCGGSINVSLTQDHDYIIGTVEDSGIGISQECKPHIFEQFYRAKNAKSMNRHGTGLGLSIVKRIVETYGGKISFESEGKGTKFTFTLPKFIDDVPR